MTLAPSPTRALLMDLIHTQAPEPALIGPDAMEPEPEPYDEWALYPDHECQRADARHHEEGL